MASTVLVPGPLTRVELMLYIVHKSPRVTKAAIAAVEDTPADGLRGREPPG